MPYARHLPDNASEEPIIQPWNDSRLKVGGTYIGCVNKANADRIMALQASASADVDNLALKDMSTVPGEAKAAGSRTQVLVLHEHNKNGDTEREWRMAYWSDGAHGLEPNWYGAHAGDRLNPLGWVTHTGVLDLAGA